MREKPRDVNVITFDEQDDFEKRAAAFAASGGTLMAVGSFEGEFTVMLSPVAAAQQKHMGNLLFSLGGSMLNNAENKEN